MNIFDHSSHIEAYIKTIKCEDCNQKFLDYMDFKHHNSLHDYEGFSIVKKSPCYLCIIFHDGILKGDCICDYCGCLERYRERYK